MLQSVDGTCVFVSELLAGYTIAKLSRFVGVLVAFTCVVCVGAALAIAGVRGLRVVPVIVCSYAALAGFLNVFGISVDMIMMIAILVTPGFLTDYSLHLAHSRTNQSAVAFSALTTIASLATFWTVDVPSMAHFAMTYSLTICAGAVFSIVFAGGVL